jgi:alpha-glucosidase
MKLKYQFMLGEDLMVLPVLESGADEVRGYLPEGKWKHTSSGKVYEGNSWIEVEAKIGEPAAFIRMGAKSQTLLEKALIGVK